MCPNGPLRGWNRNGFQLFFLPLISLQPIFANFYLFVQDSGLHCDQPYYNNIESSDGRKLA